MSRGRIFAIGVIAAILTVAVLSIAFLLLAKEETRPSGMEKIIAEFEEFDEEFTYIDADGNARCIYVAQLPPSPLSDLLKQIIQLTGVDVEERDYEGSIRESQARYGLEVDNILCEITGLGAGESLRISISWEVPKAARWSDNRWTIEFNWIDNQGAVKEIIDELESSWSVVRSVAGSAGVDVALYRISYRGTTILPEGSENVYSEGFGTIYFIDYGGGSYTEGSIDLGQVNGRPAILENSITLIATENEMAITPQRFLEQYEAHAISYEGVSPESPSFIDSLTQLRLDLKYGRELRGEYPIFSEGFWYSLTPAQLLYFAADAIVAISQGEHFSLPRVTEGIALADGERGEWHACWGNLTEAQYVSLAREVLDCVSACGAAPGEIESPIGKMRFRDLLYTFVRILSYHGKHGELPDRITFAPVPSGELNWGVTTIPANHAYYLLPDLYVITGSAAVKEVLENIRDNVDYRSLAEEICNWTGSNITYQLSFRPATSEEVLESRKGQCRDFTNVYLAIARTAGIPSRRVSGQIVSEWQPPAGWEFVITTLPDGRTVAGHAWVQVYILGEGWIPAEPQSKRPYLYFGEPPYEIYRQCEQTWMTALADYEAAAGPL